MNFGQIQSSLCTTLAQEVLHTQKRLPVSFRRWHFNLKSVCFCLYFILFANKLLIRIIIALNIFDSCSVMNLYYEQFYEKERKVSFGLLFKLSIYYPLVLVRADLFLFDPIFLISFYFSGQVLSGIIHAVGTQKFSQN